MRWETNPMNRRRLERSLRPVLTGLAVSLLALGASAAVSAPGGATVRHSVELAGNGLGVVNFGSSLGSVTKAVSAKLGPPTGHPSAGCVGGYSQVAWHNLIAQFRHGRFTGYRYWTLNASGKPLEPGATVSPRLKTAKGITLGSTFAQLKDLYKLTQTGTDFWKAPNGIVFALNSPTYPSPPGAPIYEIKTFGVCPPSL